MLATATVKYTDRGTASVYGSAQTGRLSHGPIKLLENHRRRYMYIGGILGTILIVALIFYFVRRS